MATAILVDGAYFIKRFRRLEPHNAYDAGRAAELVHRWAIAHLSTPKNGQARAEGRRSTRKELYRVFFYDCPPLALKHHNPISKRAVDFSKSDEALFRVELHRLLLAKRKVALRLGELSKDVSWVIKPQKVKLLLQGKLKAEELTPDDVRIDTKQKGVDMRIGVDVASLAFKKQVDQIVLMAGDADFVPAAKMARREGIDFVLDPMRQDIPSGLMEHIDGLRSTCPKPAPRAARPDGAGDQKHG